MSETQRPDAIPERMILEFERPIIELWRKIGELREISDHSASDDFTTEIRRLEQNAQALQQEIFSSLTAQQKVRLSRHPGRPYSLDYWQHLFTDVVELHGDRSFGDDPAIVGAMAQFEGTEVLVIGHQKGRNTKENLHRNFGMARPEGYRKSARLMRLASRFGRPIICFVDTPGAYPGLGAEERGQAEAIAKSLQVMASLEVPVISVVIGEGGSGGALALGVADRILMLEYSTYSVISPEGCASILWRDPAKVPDAAEQLRMTAPDLLEFGICDEVIAESPGGAHRDLMGTAENLRRALRKHLADLSRVGVTERQSRRYDKFRRIGTFTEHVLP